MTKPAVDAARARRTITGTFAVVAAAALAAALVAGLRAEPGPPRVPVAQPVAFIIGDSQAVGSSTVSEDSTWVARGVAGLGYLPYVQGAGGTGFVTAPDSAPSLEPFPQAYQRWEKPDAPRLIVIEGGGNDVAATDEAIADAATELIDMVREDYADLPVVVVAPIGDGGGRRAEIAEVLERVAVAEHTLFVDPRDWWTQYGLGEYLVDAKHLSARGHVVAGERFTAALREAGVPAVQEQAPREAG